MIKYVSFQKQQEQLSKRIKTAFPRFFGKIGKRIATETKAHPACTRHLLRDVVKPHDAIEGMFVEFMEKKSTLLHG